MKMMNKMQNYNLRITEGNINCDWT